MKRKRANEVQVKKTYHGTEKLTTEPRTATRGNALFDQSDLNFRVF